MATVYYPYRAYFREWGNPKSAEKTIRVTAKDRKQAKRKALISLKNRGGPRKVITRIELV